MDDDGTDDVASDADVRDELPEDLNASEYVGPYVFPNNNRRRIPGYLYLALGAACEHEHERGRLQLYPHPITAVLTLDEVSPYPFREHWLKEGVELFHPVEQV